MKIDVEYYPSIQEVDVDSPTKRLQDWQFLTMANKYRHHYCEGNKKKDCFVCEAIEVIDGGRTEIALQNIGKEMEF